MTISRSLFSQEPEKDALLSPDGVYRYCLKRIWDDDKPLTVWVMLNPSTADASTDDATVRKVCALAQRCGCGGIYVLNLFALRATDPRELKSHPDPVGPHNDKILATYAEGMREERWVAAWGAHGKYRNRDRDVTRILLMHGIELKCLGITKDGSPRHPLYVANATELLDLPEPE